MANCQLAHPRHLLPCSAHEVCRFVAANVDGQAAAGAEARPGKQVVACWLKMGAGQGGGEGMRRWIRLRGEHARLSI